MLFEEPAHTQLPTPAAWGGAETKVDTDLLVAQLDVDNAFYRVRFPPGVSEHFALPPVSLEGLRRLDPSLVLEGLPGSDASPHLEVLAMGWSWSLYFCQAPVLQSALDSGLTEEQIVRDRHASPVISKDSTHGAVYVDNGSIVGGSPAPVNRAGRRLLQTM